MAGTNKPFKGFLERSWYMDTRECLSLIKKTRFRQLLHNGKQFTLKPRNLNKTRLPYFLEYSFKYCSLEFVPYIYKFYYSIKRRKMITYGLFKSSKFGSLIIFQCHYPWHQSLIFHWSVLLVRSDSTLTWQGGDKRNRRRQEGGGGGGDYFKYAVNVIIYQLATLYTILFTDRNLKYCWVKREKQ